ncbi:MAG: glycosyltransferase family 87 protein [Alphaproteobacteria bacterium]
MAGFLDILRSGDWLISSRARLWAIAVLIASAGGLVYLVATSDGLIDYQGRPLGTDFSNVYAAGTHVLDGNPAAPFDPRLQHAREQSVFGEKTPFYGWHYPPFFLAVAAGLALMPYQLALIVWQGVTLVLYLLAIRMIVSPLIPPPQGEGGRRSRPGGALAANTDTPPDRRFAAATLPASQGGIWLLLALAYPAVFVNLGHGHNGFLTAALMGFALIMLDARPILAGILFGLLAYKPQFGLMIPLVLLATGRWRTLIAAGATVAALIVAATLAFGVEAWRAFFTFAEYTRTIVLETGETGWHKIQSVFAWARMWGAPVSLAYAIQAAITLLVAAALIWLWRSPTSYALKAAALCLAAILATPYSLDYDLMVLAPAIAFLTIDGLERDFAPWEKSALAFLWAVPLVARGVAQVTFIPLGVIAMMVMFGLILHRAGLLAARGNPVPAR